MTAASLAAVRNPTQGASVGLPPAEPDPLPAPARRGVEGRVAPVAAHRRATPQSRTPTEPRRPLEPPRGLELGRDATPEWLVVEEPLQILIAGEPWVVTLRTPGHDHELALGLLLAEGLAASAADVGSVAHCGKPGESRNTLNVLPAPGTALPWPPESGAGESRRGTLMNAACGLCGRQSIDELMRRCQPVPSGAPLFDSSLVQQMLERLGARQALFEACGATHAAGLWDFVPASGAQSLADEVVREDVGRHNAVDKALGRWALSGVSMHCPVLAVSGRCSFEMVQKAVVAKVRLLVCVSAPTSLAVRAAKQLGLTLVAFGRSDRFTIYSGVDRFRSVD